MTAASGDSPNSTNPINTSEENKIDPSEDINLEDLEKIDFSNKPKHLRELDEIVFKEQEAAADPAVGADPFLNVYVLTYKGRGPIEFILFRSRKVLPLVTRDCQVWCNSRGYRFLSTKKVFVNINLAPTADQVGAPAGDISDIVTRQSRRPPTPTKSNFE